MHSQAINPSFPKFCKLCNSLTPDCINNLQLSKSYLPSSRVVLTMTAVSGPFATVPARTVQEYATYGLKPETVMDSRDEEMLRDSVPVLDSRVTM